MTATLRTQENEGVLVVYFTDAKILDDSRIQQIGKDLIDVTANALEKKLVLNFRGVNFMSSAMIGKLVLLNKKCKEEEVALKICDISPEIYQVFKIMKLNKIFDVQKDEEKAVKSFNKKGWFG